MIAKEIELALARKFSGQGWAFFQQYRPMTSFEATMNSIDAVAVGLWHQNNKMIAFEIKVARSDFLKDVDTFRHKHRFALEITHEFYYICPWGLIDKSEVPEIAGLMYVNKSFSITKKKPAVVRELKDMPFHLFQGFAREFGNKVDQSKLPIKYLGKDISQEDFLALVEEKKNWSFNQDVEKRAEEIIKERGEKEDGENEFIKKLRDVSGYYMKDEEAYTKILRFCKIGQKLAGDHNFKHNFDTLKRTIQRVEELIDREDS